MSKMIVLGFDGTGNGASDEIHTNVYKFHKALSKEGQTPFYYAGPGDEDNTNGWWDRLAGLTLGIGTGEIVDKALEDFEDVYEDGDKIATHAFSRGGAAGRITCSEITKMGHTVQFLGCWDTVAAFMPFGPAQQETLFGDLHVSPLVENAFHAVALHEDRAAFAPNLMNKRKGITEVWFKGNHANVGGGYPETGLSDITLKWMIQNATKCGLKFNPISLHPDPDAPVHREKYPLRRAKRHIGVKKNDKWCGDAAVLF